MKGAQLPGELRMKDARAMQANSLAIAAATADRVRNRVQRLRAEPDSDGPGPPRDRTSAIAPAPQDPEEREQAIRESHVLREHVDMLSDVARQRPAPL